MGEVTAATVLKGKTRELVYRHATTLILLIPREYSNDGVSMVEDSSSDEVSSGNLNLETPGDIRPARRKAACEGQQKTNAMIQQDLV